MITIIAVIWAVLISNELSFQKKYDECKLDESESKSCLLTYEKMKKSRELLEKE